MPRTWLVPFEEQRASEDAYLGGFNYAARTNAFAIGDGRVGGPLLIVRDRASSP